MNNTTPAGWFPDPEVPGQQRYWNGQVWTEHTAPVHHANNGFAAGQQPAVAGRPGAPAPERSGNWFVRHPVLAGAAGFCLFLVVVGVAAGVAGSGGSDGETVASDDTSTSVVEKPAAAVEAEPSTVAEPVVEPEPVDTDGDGVNDEDDFRPDDPAVRTQDDVDTDGDGVPDYQDDFPEDPAFSKDTDGDDVPDRLDAFPKDPRFSKDSDGDGVADSQDAFPSDPSKSEITLAMENALSAAEDYLDYTAFSRQGLIDQLSSEYGSGFELEDATWAVGQLSVDWKEQAVIAAQDYLDYTSFSRQGLIDQLSSPYGSQFTVEEATFAVNQIGL
jgi:hypothetical protein